MLAVLSWWAILEVLGLLALPLTLAWIWHGGRWRLAALSCWLAVVACWAADRAGQRLPVGHVRGHVLDVGHGDCIALDFADGSHLLLDGGGFVGDDGLIYILATDKNYVEWQEEAGPTRWNVYEGDLSVLKATGIYTQPLGSNPL